MPGISFGDKIDSVWIVAGWAFRQALKDLTPHAGGDTAFLDALTGAGHIGFLDVQSLQDPARVEMTRAVELCAGEYLMAAVRLAFRNRFLILKRERAIEEESSCCSLWSKL